MKEETVSLREILSKEVVTSVVDYNLSSINELLKSEHIDLRPGYQRRFRWSTANQSRLIESFLLNVPVPSVFLSEDELGHYFVIDGQQRLNAVKNFINGELKLEGLRVLENLNGCRFNE
jgi:hypothetical protein